mmetsp:Transcript_126309/g.243505  ORF Transcript_126309/g.243505 Transcript_126309/m.243505 type:complete len:233 (+) Transcript_126309:626-1324(+)
MVRVSGSWVLAWPVRLSWSRHKRLPEVWSTSSAGVYSSRWMSWTLRYRAASSSASRHWMQKCVSMRSRFLAICWRSIYRARHWKFASGHFLLHCRSGLAAEVLLAHLRDSNSDHLRSRSWTLGWIRSGCAGKNSRRWRRWSCLCARRWRDFAEMPTLGARLLWQTSQQHPTWPTQSQSRLLSLTDPARHGRIMARSAHEGPATTELRHQLWAGRVRMSSKVSTELLQRQRGS